MSPSMHASASSTLADTLHLAQQAYDERGFVAYTTTPVGPENSCNPGQVVMMEPVNSREVDDMRRLGGTYRPMVGCIAGE